MHERTRNALRDTGYTMVSIEAGVTDEEITTRAQQSTEKQILCVHLSTLLCPAHRKEYIRWIRHWTKVGGQALCVSTALIEAGINVSFPIVVRSLAGLPSVIQAAGRCNRNCEWETGKVYLWELAEERLGMLEQIAEGKGIPRDLVHRCADNYDALGEPEMISEYFQREQTEYTKTVQRYPLDGANRSIVGLLSKNKQEDGIKYAIPMRQAFREAGKRFHAIPDETKPVLVPYGEGKNVIVALREPHTMEEEIRLLRKAQSYCVNVYDNWWMGIGRLLDNIRASITQKEAEPIRFSLFLPFCAKQVAREE